MDTSKSDLSVLSAEAPKDAPRSTPLIPERKFDWRTRVLLPGFILSAFVLLLGYTAREALWPAKTVQVVPVVLKTATGTISGVAFQAAGWVEADPFPTYASALTDGIVKEVLVLEGQPVKAGDVIARLIDDDAKLNFARADAELRQREAELLNAQATLAAAQSNWDNPVERTRAVSMAENGLREAEGELKHLNSEIGVEQARLDELREQLRREDIASEKSAIPEFQKIQTKLKAKTQEATLAALECKRSIMNAKIGQQEAELKAATDNLRLRIAEKKELDGAKAALQQANAARDMAHAVRDEAALRLERMAVRSPADGVVMQRLTEPGAKLMLGMDDRNSAQAARLYNPKRLQVRVDVPLAEAARVGVGQDAQIVVEVLRDRTFKGRVTRIVNEADIQKNTLQVKVAIDDPAPELKPEMLARVQFAAVSAKGGDAALQRLFAREDLLQRHGEHAFAWVVDKGRSAAVQRSLTLGTTRQEGWIEVTSGLQPGDVLISGDTSNLADGARVRIAEEGGAHGAH